MKRKIYLIRHAEPLKAQKDCWGRNNPPLSPSGVNQAESLAVALSDSKLEAVYSSDLRSAKETAAIIAARQCCPSKPYIGLREVRLGEWEGCSIFEIQKKYGNWRQDIVKLRPPGGESYADLAKRVLAVFTEITSQTNGNIAIVSHAGVNRVLLCQLLQINLKNLFSIRQNFAHVSIIEQINSIFRIAELNMHENLQPTAVVLH